MKLKLTNVLIIGAIVVVIAVLVFVFIKKPVEPSTNPDPSNDPAAPSGKFTEIKDGKNSGKCNGTGTLNADTTSDDCNDACRQDINCKGFDFSTDSDGSIGGTSTTGQGKCTTYTTTPTSAKKAKYTTCLAKS